MAAESLNLTSEARDILATPSLKELEIILERLAMGEETNEHQKALALFDFCADNYPNCLALKLLKVYRFSSNGFIRFNSIYLLSEILADFRTSNFELSRVTLSQIKPLLIQCLTMEEIHVMIVRRVVSLIVYNVMICGNDGWFELSDCILSLADKEPLKAFHFFVELPRVYMTFIEKIVQVIVEKASVILLNPEEDGVEEWSLALQTLVKMGIQILDTEMRKDLVKYILEILENSVKELVEKDMEPFLVKGLERLERFVSGDRFMYSYSKNQCLFVITFMYKIKDFGTLSKEIVRRINKLVKPPENPASKVIRSQPQDQKQDRGWFDHLKTLSSLEVLNIFASTDIEDWYREIAIRRLEVVLSDHTSKKKVIDVSEMRQLQPLLICCLKQKGISDSMFKVLGEVMSHVVYEMTKHQDVVWNDLREYIASQSKTKFERAVYIFQCLTMQLEDDDFVIHVITNLLPEISTRLNPPRELLVDNSCWVLAFTGAFCATIHLLKIPSHAEPVKEIANKMIDSVKELVERGMEVGLVRRAFRDLERIVKKQFEWYGTIEYKFVKGLLWKLYAIKGMKWESKIVLWRVNVIVERGVKEEVKEFPKGEFDWLNLRLRDLYNLKFGIV